MNRKIATKPLLYICVVTSIAFADISYSLNWAIDVVRETASPLYVSGLSLCIDLSESPHIGFYISDWDFPEAGTSIEYAYWDGAQWELSEVDVSAWTISDVSIATDSSGVPHLAYEWVDGSILHQYLRYAYWDGSDWELSVVDNSGGFYTSIALSDSDVPHISYYDRNAYKLKHASKNAGGQWEIEEVTGVADGCYYTSIALDSSGYPRISYSWYEVVGEITWIDYQSIAEYDGISWVFTDLWGFWGSGDCQTSIDVDSSGKTGVVYNGSGIDYYYDGIHEDVAGGTESPCPKLKYDSNDKPHVSFHGDSYNEYSYGYKEGGEWYIEAFDGGGTVLMGPYNNSLALDTSDNPHIAYRVGFYEFFQLRYARAFENTPPSSFDLLSPPDGSEVSDTLTLDWGDSTDADGDTITYDVWYAADPSFDPHDEVTDLSDSTYTFPEGVLTQEETYYWRVRATDGWDETWSGPDEYWSFTAENEPPGDFDLTAPPDGSTVTEPVTLDWEDSIDQGRMLTVGAGSSRTAADTSRSEFTRSITYDLWYATDPSFDPHDEVNELTESTYTFPEGVLTQGETYYWKVRAWDGFDATWSGPDPYWSFTVEEEVTDIPVTAFSAGSARNGIELTWECADPGVGFNLYRSEEATGVRTKLWETLNAELITGESPYSYLDAAVENGVIYSYWLEAIDVGGASEKFGPVRCTAGTFVPTAYALYQSRPNPARGAAVIAFDLPEDADVTLTVYDLSGRKVMTLVDEKLPTGVYERSVSGLPPGVYVYRLEAGEFVGVRKMVVVE